MLLTQSKPQNKPNSCHEGTKAQRHEENTKGRSGDGEITRNTDPATRQHDNPITLQGQPVTRNPQHERSGTRERQKNIPKPVPVKLQPVHRIRNLKAMNDPDVPWVTQRVTKA